MYTLTHLLKELCAGGRYVVDGGAGYLQFLLRQWCHLLWETLTQPTLHTQVELEEEAVEVPTQKLLK